MRQRAAEAIQFPDNQHVAVPHVVERRSQSRTIGPRPGGSIFKHLRASGRRECVELQRRVLADRANARVADIRHGDLSDFPSGNHVVRVPIGGPGFPDNPDVTAQRSFDGQLPLGSRPFTGGPRWHTDSC
jgi:hypothetical protein